MWLSWCDRRGGLRMTRKLPWSVISVVSVITGLNLVFDGCGRDNGEIVPSGDGGDGSSGSTSTSSGSTTSSGGSSGTSGDSANDAPANETGINDGQTCLLVGQPCTAAAQCCNKACNIPTGLTVGECAAAA